MKKKGIAKKKKYLIKRIEVIKKRIICAKQCKNLNKKKKERCTVLSIGQEGTIKKTVIIYLS